MHLLVWFEVCIFGLDESKFIVPLQRPRERCALPFRLLHVDDVFEWRRSLIVVGSPRGSSEYGQKIHSDLREGHVQSEVFPVTFDEHVVGEIVSVAFVVAYQMRRDLRVALSRHRDVHLAFVLARDQRAPMADRGYGDTAGVVHQPHLPRLGFRELLLVGATHVWRDQVVADVLEVCVVARVLREQLEDVLAVRRQFRQEVHLAVDDVMDDVVVERLLVDVVALEGVFELHVLGERHLEGHLRLAVFGDDQTAVMVDRFQTDGFGLASRAPQVTVRQWVWLARELRLLTVYDVRT